MLPVVAQQLNMAHSHKEGWLSGLAEVLLKQGKEQNMILSVAFPIDNSMTADSDFSGCVEVHGSRLRYFGFREDTLHPEQYDDALEARMDQIIKAVSPDVIHCFGTEYPHTLAAVKACPDKKKVLVGIQGIVSACADAYMANLPLSVIKDVTFRDWLKKDSIMQQQQKFAARAVHEKTALELAGNVTGRTVWDKAYMQTLNPAAVYFSMNETLRSGFYQGGWSRAACQPHRIFVSQGDYPLKGMHYALKALPKIREQYPDVSVYAAGNNLTAYRTWKDKIKLSAYGKYLRSLIRNHHLEEAVHFLGSLDESGMKEQYLKADCFLCCSSIENSPNSLGEAMLLGVPCVSADVGGVPSLFRDGVDGILYQGYRIRKTAKQPEDEHGKKYAKEGNEWKEADELLRYGVEEQELDAIADRIADSILALWKDPKQADHYGQNARQHALDTHNGVENYQRMLDIYEAIAQNARISDC